MNNINYGSGSYYTYFIDNKTGETNFYKGRRMQTKQSVPKSCGECEFSKGQYNIFGTERFDAVTCVKLNCGTLRFERNKRCPLILESNNRSGGGDHE